jgi:two-component system, NarL family, response regulator NreC
VGPPAQVQDSNEKIRCALLHDHVLLRQGLRRMLEDERDIQVVAEVGSVSDALRQFAGLCPQVVIADPHLFECAPQQAEQLILQRCPKARVLFLSTRGTDDLPASDESRFIVRQTSISELLTRIKRSADTQAPAEIRQRDVAEWPIEELLPRQRLLTTRERQVLKLLAEGRTVRSAAAILGLSVKTVDAHKFNLMRKLGLHNKAELVMWAIQKRVVKLPVNF